MEEDRLSPKLGKANQWDKCVHFEQAGWSQVPKSILKYIFFLSPPPTRRHGPAHTKASNTHESTLNIGAYFFYFLCLIPQTHICRLGESFHACSTKLQWKHIVGESSMTFTHSLTPTLDLEDLSTWSRHPGLKSIVLIYLDHNDMNTF